MAFKVNAINPAGINPVVNNNFNLIMRYLGSSGVILLLIIISFIIANDRLNYNNCMERVKLEYISKKGAAHIAVQCKAFVLDKIMAN